eukprot:6350079-Alexandrium_andersonii.AAC.1
MGGIGMRARRQSARAFALDCATSACARASFTRARQGGGAASSPRALRPPLLLATLEWASEGVARGGGGRGRGKNAWE